VVAAWFQTYIMKFSHLAAQIASFTALSHALQAPRVPQAQPQQQGLLHAPEAQHELLSETSSEVLSLHRKLVEIDSVTGNEHDVGKFLVSYLEDHNFTVEAQEVSPKRFNILAYIGKQKNTKTLVTSHIDTVRLPSPLPSHPASTC